MNSRQTKDESGLAASTVARAPVPRLRRIGQACMAACAAVSFTMIFIHHTIVMNFAAIGFAVGGLIAFVLQGLRSAAEPRA
jgi:hypothetical protein